MSNLIILCWEILCHLSPLFLGLSGIGSTLRRLCSVCSLGLVGKDGIGIRRQALRRDRRRISLCGIHDNQSL